MLLILAIISLFQAILNVILYKTITHTNSKIANKVVQILSSKAQIINPKNPLDEIEI